jgi:uncharacterized membrane protein YecN with MAPEG domain
MIVMKFTALVTLAALLLTFALSGRSGSMRRKFGIAAPATTGNLEYEKANRIHYKTIEQLVLFLPLLWLGAAVIGDSWAGLIGIVWLVGRILYATAYRRDPAKRGPGMIVTLLATSAVGASVVWGIVRAFLG